MPVDASSASRAAPRRTSAPTSGWRHHDGARGRHSRWCARGNRSAARTFACSFLRVLVLAFCFLLSLPAALPFHSTVLEPNFNLKTKIWQWESPSLTSVSSNTRHVFAIFWRIYFLGVSLHHFCTPTLWINTDNYSIEIFWKIKCWKITSCVSMRHQPERFWA